MILFLALADPIITSSLFFKISYTGYPPQNIFTALLSSWIRELTCNAVKMCSMPESQLCCSWLCGVTQLSLTQTRCYNQVLLTLAFVNSAIYGPQICAGHYSVLRFHLIFNISRIVAICCSCCIVVTSPCVVAVRDLEQDGTGTWVSFCFTERCAV